MASYGDFAIAGLLMLVVPFLLRVVEWRQVRRSLDSGGRSEVGRGRLFPQRNFERAYAGFRNPGAHRLTFR
jgi:hypothetical protein